MAQKEQDQKNAAEKPLQGDEAVKEFHRRIGHKGAVTLHEKIKRGEVQMPESED